jgi:hypothetical protein
MNVQIEPENPWSIAEMELTAARLARSAGNEGKARVCARRAAGKALNVAGISSEPPLAAIRNFMQSDTLPIDIRSACINLLRTVDGNYNLAEGIDLISDAELIMRHLKSKPFA